MNRINLNRDVWPYVKYMDIRMYGKYMDTPDDVMEIWKGQRRIDSTTDFSSISPMPSFNWGYSTVHDWAELLAHGFEPHAPSFNGIIFIIERICTKTDVVLTGDDVIIFIEPQFNRMLRTEDLRKCSTRRPTPQVMLKRLRDLFNSFGREMK